MKPDKTRLKLIPNHRPRPNHARFSGGTGGVGSVPPFHNPQQPTHVQMPQQQQHYSQPPQQQQAAHYPAPLATQNGIVVPQQDSMMAMAMVCQQAMQLQQDNQELTRKNQRLEQDNMRLKRNAAYGGGVVITSHMAGRYHGRRHHDYYDAATDKPNNQALFIVLMMIWLGFALIVILGLLLR